MDLLKTVICVVISGVTFFYGLYSVHYSPLFTLSAVFIILPFILRLKKEVVQKYALLLGSSFVAIMIADTVIFKNLLERRVFQEGRLFDESRKDVLKKYAERGKTPIAAYHHFLEYVLIPHSTPECNQEGFGGKALVTPKPKNEIRIFCLGGSTTYGGFGEASYPFHLQDYLDQISEQRYVFNVQNAGVPAYTTLHSLINLESRILYHAPDYVIIYHGINDLMYHAPGIFKPDFSHTSYISIMFRNWLEQGLFPIRWNGMNLIPDTQAYDTEIGLYQIAQISSLVQYVVNTKNFSTRRTRAISRKYIALPENYPQDIQPGDIPQVNNYSEKALEAFRNNIYHMIVLCKSHNITPVLTTFTFGNIDNPNYAETIKGYGRFLTLEATMKVLDLQNNIIRELSIQTGVPLVDIRNDIPVNATSFTDGIHFTKNFAQLVGEFIGKRLYTSHLAKEPIALP